MTKIQDDIFQFSILIHMMCRKTNISSLVTKVHKSEVKHILPEIDFNLFLTSSFSFL